MTKRSSLRASDADRDRVAERLRQATTEGRLLAHEFEERLARALRARTYGELDDVVADLPGSPVAMVRSRPSSLQLALHHPMAVAGVLLVAAVALTSLVVTAAAVVASGLWLLPIVLFFVWPAHRRRRQFGRGSLRAHTPRTGRSRPGRIT